MICPENDKHAEFHRPASFHIFILPLKMNKTKNTDKIHFMHHFYESTEHMLAHLCSTILCNTPTKRSARAEAKKKKNNKKQEYPPTSVTSHSAAWLCGNFCVHMHTAVKRPVRAHTYVCQHIKHEFSFIQPSIFPLI